MIEYDPQRKTLRKKSQYKTHHCLSNEFSSKNLFMLQPHVKDFKRLFVNFAQFWDLFTQGEARLIEF